MGVAPLCARMRHGIRLIRFAGVRLIAEDYCAAVAGHGGSAVMAWAETWAQ
jgi:hypothetical protein